MISLRFCHTFLIDLDIPITKLGVIFFRRILEAISHSFFDGCRVNRLPTKEKSEYKKTDVPHDGVFGKYACWLSKTRNSGWRALSCNIYSPQQSISDALRAERPWAAIRSSSTEGKCFVFRQHQNEYSKPTHNHPGKSNGETPVLRGGCAGTVRKPFLLRKF